MESKLTAHQLNETAQYCFGDEINFLHEVSLYWCDKAVMIGAGPGVMALALLEEQDEEFEFDISGSPTLQADISYRLSADLQE